MVREHCDRPGCDAIVEGYPSWVSEQRDGREHIVHFGVLPSGNRARPNLGDTRQYCLLCWVELLKLYTEFLVTPPAPERGTS